jgi:hypothetical protein
MYDRLPINISESVFFTAELTVCRTGFNCRYYQSHLVEERGTYSLVEYGYDNQHTVPFCRLGH